MKRVIPFLLFLSGIACASGYLMSKLTGIGKIGITLMHREYQFLKIWWEGAIAVFLGLLILFLIHSVFYKIVPFLLAKFLDLVLLAAAIYSLYFTYTDFHVDVSHRLLGEHFHLGAYLFFVGWILICFFFLFKSKPKKALKDLGNKAA